MNAHNPAEPDWLTPRTFRQLLGCSRATFGRLRAEGRLPPPCRTDGARRYWCRKAVEAWLLGGGTDRPRPSQRRQID